MTKILIDRSVLEQALSKFKPENQERLRQWIADGTFIERALGVMWEQEVALAEKPAEQEPRFFWDEVDGCLHEPNDTDRPDGCIALYTTPQPAKREPLTDEAQRDVDAAAKTLAECMDYPWSYMPEEGRAEMRKHARAVIAAYERKNGIGK